MSSSSLQQKPGTEQEIGLTRDDQLGDEEEDSPVLSTSSIRLPEVYFGGNNVVSSAVCLDIDSVVVTGTLFGYSACLRVSIPPRPVGYEVRVNILLCTCILFSLSPTN